MTQEEKARAYDEALKVAHRLYEQGTITESLSYIFPELKESEDERIRKILIENFSNMAMFSYWGATNKIQVSDIIAWLEKQGEQKELNLVEILKHYPRETELYSPLYGKLWLAEVDEEHEIITCYKHPLEKECTRAVLEQEGTVSFYSNGTTGLPDCSVSKDCMLFLYDIEKQDGNSIRKRYDRIKDSEWFKETHEGMSVSDDGNFDDGNEVEPKFKVGDWVVRGDTIAQILGIQEQYYVGLDIDGKYFTSSRFLNADKIRPWTIQDAKDGDVLYCNNVIYLSHGNIKPLEQFHAYFGVSFNGTPFTFINEWCCLAYKDKVLPATKEQRDILFTKMKEAGYEWNDGKIGYLT